MLKQQIMTDMKQCMKAKMQTELTGIRMLNAAIKNKEIDLKKELTDAEIIAIVKKQIKEHKDSLSYIKDQDSADEMPEEEAKTIIEKLLAENNISGKSNMGPAMKLVKPVLEGKIDNSKISKIVKELL